MRLSDLPFKQSDLLSAITSGMWTCYFDGKDAWMSYDGEDEDETMTRDVDIRSIRGLERRKLVTIDSPYVWPTEIGQEIAERSRESAKLKKTRRRR